MYRDYDRYLLSLDLEQPVVLEIYDTAGQEFYGSLPSFYYSKADAILIFYSIDDPKSLENVDSWAKTVLDYCSIDAHLYIVENKNDLKENSDENLLITDAGKDKAQELNAHFESVSAKTGDNVKKLFLKIANECLQNERLINGEPEPINLEKPTGDKKSYCNC